ncbi:MAG: hypothetical protein EA419_02000 [Wenzhouxiangella sp.]|nr:MAG: hypothetical protein EA419_02000 [Wenzhouxiangella sp.]
MHRFLLPVLLCLALPDPAMARDWAPDASSAWPAGGGSGAIQLRGDYLPDLGVEVLEADEPVRERRFAPLTIGDPRLWLYMPFGNFEGFTGGALEARSALALRHGDQVVRLDRLHLLPARQQQLTVLQLHDGHGNHLANVTHMHVTIDHRRGEMALRNADVRATARLAAMLGQPALTNLSIGELRLDARVTVPEQADRSGRGVDHSGRGLSCADRPLWPQDGFEVDVALIGVNFVTALGQEPDTGRLKIAPAATLKNVGEADVPWFQQFQPADPALYPHEPRDQHPFLVWNLYRIHNGRMEQLAASGVKHAFFSQNLACQINCGNGNILWPGCEDTYSTQNNDTATFQGPRSEITPHLGLWDSCGSFFDPGCTGSQTGFAGDWKHRLLVDPQELTQADADYFIDAWYVIQYDVNIWNGMGYHRIEPETVPPSGQTFSLDPFIQGSPMREWVPEGQSTAEAAHQLIVVESDTPEAPYPDNMPLGHLRVLAQVEDLGDGSFRYRYAVMNFDLSSGVHEFRVPLPPDADLLEAWMGGPPDVLETAWPHDRLDRSVRFRAPEGHSLPWFTLYNFEIVVNKQPLADGPVQLVSESEGGARTLEARMPIPDPSVFRDRFE